MVPEIWSTTDRIFCHFGLFFALLHPPPPPPLTTWKIKILKKQENFFEKIQGYIIILHTFTVNENHMMYGSSDMKHNRENFFSFWTIFCPFTLFCSFKILNNEKNISGYHHFTQVNCKWQSYDVWFLRYGARQTEFFVILDYFLPFYKPTTPHPS